MDPFTWIAIAFMAVSAITEAVSAIQQGKATSRAAETQAEYNRQVAEAQAKQAKNNAEWAEYKLDVFKQQQEEKKKQAQKTATEKIAAAKMKKGIASGSGSLLAGEVNSLFELDETLRLIDWETWTEAQNVKKEKADLMNQADIYKSQGEYSMLKGEMESEAATTQGYYSAGSSLLAGGAQIAGAYKPGTPKPTSPTGLSDPYSYNYLH